MVLLSEIAGPIGFDFMLIILNAVIYKNNIYKNLLYLGIK